MGITKAVAAITPRVLTLAMARETCIKQSNLIVKNTPFLKEARSTTTSYSLILFTWWLIPKPFLAQVAKCSQLLLSRL